jgi:hypothetical protein
MSEFADALRRIAKIQEEQERDRTEMFLQVGRAIVTLSEIEEYMAEIFMVLSEPMSNRDSAAIFYEVQNLSHKLKLVGYAVTKRCWPDGQKRWPELSGRILAQKFVRNVAAHASLEFKQQKGEAKTWRVMLGTQAMDKTHKKSEFEIEDMKKAADELQGIQAAVKSFLIHALRHIGPTDD